MNNKPRRPWIAALFTLLTIGLGHLYAGNPKRGLILFCIAEILIGLLFVLLIFIFPDFITFIFVVCNILGFAVLVFCVFDAISIAKRNKENYELAKYNRWFVYVGYCIILFLVSSLVSPNDIKAYKIPSRSMLPTLLVGDHILVNEFIYGVKIPLLRNIIIPVSKPKRGDIVVFIYPKDRFKEFIKRVVGVGGDTIEIKDKIIFINDKEFKDSYGVYSDSLILPKSMQPRDNFGPVTVPEKAIFVMGDNRDESLDSRFYGFIDLKDIIGKVFLVYWSWNRDEHKVRWDRILSKVK